MKGHGQGFPGDSVVKNPSDDAGDTGSIPDPGRSHLPCSNEACAPQLLSLCSRTLELQLLSPHATATASPRPVARYLPKEKPLQ